MWCGLEVNGGYGGEVKDREVVKHRVTPYTSCEAALRVDRWAPFEPLNIACCVIFNYFHPFLYGENSPWLVARDACAYNTSTKLVCDGGPVASINEVWSAPSPKHRGGF